MSGFRMQCNHLCSRFGSDRCWIASGQEPFDPAERDAWLENWSAEVEETLAKWNDCPGDDKEA